MNDDDHDTIFDLYKLSSSVFPEKNTWSIDEIYEHLYPKSKLHDTEIVEKLKKTLKKLEEKQAIIFINGFEALNLVEPKLLEFVSVSKSSKLSEK